MEFDKVLGVLHSWIGAEVEVSVHGGQGRKPISAVSSRGRLRTGDVLNRAGDPEVLLFTLVDPSGLQVGSFALYAEAFGGGGWLDGKEEVLEVESGVLQLLLVSPLGSE